MLPSTMIIIDVSFKGYKKALSSQKTQSKKPIIISTMGDLFVI